MKILPLFSNPILLASISLSDFYDYTTESNRCMNYLLIMVHDKIRSSSQIQCIASFIEKVKLGKIKASAELYSGLVMWTVDILV